MDNSIVSLLPNDVLTYLLFFVDNIFGLRQVCKRIKDNIDHPSFGRNYLLTRVSFLFPGHDISCIFDKIQDRPDSPYYSGYQYLPHEGQTRQEMSRWLDEHGDNALSWLYQERDKFSWYSLHRYIVPIRIYLSEYAFKDEKGFWSDKPFYEVAKCYMPCMTMFWFCQYKKDRKYDKTSTYLPRLDHYLHHDEYQEIYNLLDRRLISKRCRGKFLLLVIVKYLQVGDVIYDSSRMKYLTYLKFTTKSDVGELLRLIKRIILDGVVITGKDITIILNFLLVKNYSEEQTSSFLRAIHFNTTYLPRIIPSLCKYGYYRLLGSLLIKKEYSRQFKQKIKESFDFIPDEEDDEDNGSDGEDDDEEERNIS